MNGDINDYHKLFDSINTMIAVITDSGTILAVNSKMCQATGYERDELIGSCVSRLHDNGAEKEVGRVLEELSTASESMCVLPIITKNGSHIDTETRIYHGTWEGQSVLFGFSTDVTERRITEHKCRIIFHHSPIPILVSTVDKGKIIDANNAWCATLGYSRDFVLGKTTSQLNVWQSDADRKRIIEMFDESDAIQSAPVVFQRCNGKVIYGLISGTKISINGEECWVTSLVDKTAEYVLEEQMDKIRELAVTAALEELDNRLANNKYIK